MAAGECWLFDTWRQHRVINDAEQSRIHLVIDTVGGGDFWRLVGQGRPHGAPRDGSWLPRLVAPQAAPAAPFALETINIPEVMSPWEMNAHFALLFVDAVPHPQLARVQQLAAELSRTWRGLWARFGASPEGRPHFTAAMEQFIANVRGPAQTLALRNETRWFSAMMAMIGKSAVNSHAKGASQDEYGSDDDNAPARPAATHGAMR
jgi:hypothetical protein